MVLPNKSEVAEKPKKKEEGLKEAKPTSTNRIKDTPSKKPTISPKTLIKSEKVEDSKPQEYEGRIADLEMKLAMITEVLKSEDPSEYKINIIMEVLSIREKVKQEQPLEESPHH